MKQQPEIKVIIAQPHEDAYVTTIKNELDEFQRIVGGYIEAVGFTPDDNVCIICNEEGKINRFPLNRGLTKSDGEIWDVVAGTMIIAGDDYEHGEFISLTDEQVDKYLNQFLKPEVFYKKGGKIKSVKVGEYFEF